MKVRPLTTELQQRAKVEFDEDPDQIETNLNYIRGWIADQRHLNARTDDQWLLSFLRCCKMRMEHMKQKFDMFYTMRTKVPELFADRDPWKPELQEILKAGCTLPLPNGKDPSAPRVILFRLSKLNFEKSLFTDLIKLSFMITDILVMEDDNFTVSGQNVIIDFTNIDVSAIAQMQPMLMKKIVKCYQSAYPTRPQAIRSINVNAFFKLIYNLVQPLLTDKIKNRISVYSDNLDELYKTVSPEIIPKEYGGTSNLTIAHLTDHWKNKVESYREWFLEDQKYGTDETKRSKKLKVDEEGGFGTEGTFRKLNVD